MPHDEIIERVTPGSLHIDNL
uniref:Uncharacterized protein n=1 Tax=Anguilla anguilla TaxID=7936 RepID=A0A0E9XCP7_ANGAN